MDKYHLVTYKERPDWGPGVILQVMPGALLEVSFQIPGDRGEFVDVFHLHELEPSTQVQATA